MFEVLVNVEPDERTSEELGNEMRTITESDTADRVYASKAIPKRNNNNKYRPYNLKTQTR